MLPYSSWAREGSPGYLPACAVLLALRGLSVAGRGDCPDVTIAWIFESDGGGVFLKRVPLHLSLILPKCIFFISYPYFF